MTRVSASPITPPKLERESKLRLESIVTSDTTIESQPWFAFTPNDGTTRPTSWGYGRWRPSASSVSRPVAQSPVVGQTITLDPGVHAAWLKVTVDGEQHVLPIGTVQVR